MWVLSTSRAELHYFPNCAAITGGYAILSHTWAQDHAGEQTFQDVPKIIERCEVAGENPRNHVGEKIRQCCEIAESDGYDWVWLDSCCIDKTSSTELSEAINSMFNWYALAEVCYVYLEDVSHDEDPHAKGSKFQTARWHSRGWTLQELLAPTFIIFFSQEWKKIGTKYDLRVPLSQCTGINVEYLTREWDFRVDASIARRMSWAAERKTTRVEDEAYCLLGLFDINMPTLYGEGRHAFQRLQAELAKQSTDATLFTWGGCHDFSDGKREPGPLSESQDNTPDAPYIFLFAPSPSCFMGWSNAYSSPWGPSPECSPSLPDSRLDEKENLPDRHHDEVPSFQVTAHGMKCRLPVANFDGVTIAVLPCQVDTVRLGLLLHPASKDQTQSSSRQLYHVSWSFRERTGSGYDLFRLACLGGDAHNLRFRGKPITTTWKNIYIAAHPPTTGRTDGAHLLQRFVPDVAPTPFRIPRTLMQTLGALEFFPHTWMVSWDPASKDTMWFGCENTTLSEGIRILLGTCDKPSTNERPCHFAWADEHHSATWAHSWPEHVHDCATDHIASWSDGTREFGDAERTIRLVFAPCAHAPERTLVLGLELVGSVYEEIQKNASIHLPPPALFSRRRVNAAASRADPTGNLWSFMPTSAPSFLRPPASILICPAVSPKADCLGVAPPTNNTSSINSLDKDLRNMSIVGAHPPDRDYTPKWTTSEVEPCAAGGSINIIRQEFHEVLKAHNAARDREIQELRVAHDAQTRELNAQSAVLAQVLSILHANGISLDAPPSPVRGYNSTAPSFLPSSPSTSAPPEWQTTAPAYPSHPYAGGTHEW